MFTILDKKMLAKDIVQLTIEAGQIAAKAQAGQFVVVMAKETSERIPLTLADWNKDTGSITIIFQTIGYSTAQLAKLTTGSHIAHILGPLGHPTHIIHNASIICIGGGVGIAEMYPVARAFRTAGNKIVGILGARLKQLLILEEKIRPVCDELFITTDDGTVGRKGFVTDVLKGLLARIPPIPQSDSRQPSAVSYQLVYAIGPVPMMQAVSVLTRPYKIQTMVSLNPIMVDATGMCGSCRCTVNGKTVFGCVDGPDFDGHAVDFEELKNRLKTFRTSEEKLQKR